MKELFITAMVCLTILIITREIVKELTDVKKYKIFVELESRGLLIENEESGENE